MSGSYADTKIKVVQELAPLLGGNRILDVGTDLGLLSRFVPLDTEFVGIDVVDLSDAHKLNCDPSRIFFLNKDVYELTPGWKRYFDTVVTYSCLHWMICDFRRSFKHPFPVECTDLDTLLSTVRYYSNKRYLFDRIAWEPIDETELLNAVCKYFDRAEVLARRDDPTGFRAVVILASDN